MATKTVSGVCFNRILCARASIQLTLYLKQNQTILESIWFAPDLKSPKARGILECYWIVYQACSHVQCFQKKLLTFTCKSLTYKRCLWTAEYQSSDSRGRASAASGVPAPCCQLHLNLSKGSWHQHPALNNPLLFKYSHCSERQLSCCTTSCTSLAAHM